MSYKDYKCYKPTLWDKIVIEGMGTLSTISIFASIWLSNYRWRLFFTAIFFFFVALMHFLIMNDKEERLRKKTDSGGAE